MIPCGALKSFILSFQIKIYFNRLFSFQVACENNNWKGGGGYTTCAMSNDILITYISINNKVHCNCDVTKEKEK